MGSAQEATFVHPSSRGLIDPTVLIGTGTKVWVNVQIRPGARIGRDCTIGKDVFVDAGVLIGDRCKIQNGVSLYRGVRLEDGVFMGPHCVTTNDLEPAAVNPDGSLKGESDWQLSETIFRKGARVGANATIVCGDPIRTIGPWSLVGAGSVVIDDVPAFALVVGNPARLVRYLCPIDRRHPVELRVEEPERPWCSTCKAPLHSLV